MCTIKYLTTKFINNKERIKTIFLNHLKFSNLKYLKNICDWKVHITLCLATKVLGAFNDHKMRREIDTPSKSACSNQHLYLLFTEELFNKSSVLLAQTGMMQTNAKRQC